MKSKMFTQLMAVCVLLVGAGNCVAQAPSGAARPQVEAAFTWETMRANVVPGQTFWMQGGVGQLHVRLGHGFGIAGGGSGFHTGQMASTGVGLDLYTLTIGPRFTFDPRQHRISLYAQSLVGEAWGRNSYFPTSTGVHPSDSGLALETGGGVTVRLTQHTALRLLEGDWVRTELGNATTGRQHSMRLGSGIVFRF